MSIQNLKLYTGCDNVSQNIPRFNMPQVNKVQVDADEDSLGSSIMGSAMFMGPIMARHTIAHPFVSAKAAGKASKAFNELMKSESFAALPKSQQAEAFSTLYKESQLGSQVIKSGLRSAEETKTLAKALGDSKRAYVSALKTGDSIVAAQEAAKITEITNTGRKSIIPFVKAKDAATVLEKATKAGEAAAETAKAASTLTAATSSASKAAKALTWSKGAFKTGGGPLMLAIEGVAETPEVLTAFSEGGFGEGVKQTAKSGVKVAASTAGWCLGAKGGASVGLAIGSAICPGIGTAIGSALGLIIGGVAGSWAASKAAKAVVGKSYSEKMEAAQQQALMMPQMMPGIPNIPSETIPTMPSFPGNNPFWQFNQPNWIDYNPY